MPDEVPHAIQLLLLRRIDDSQNMNRYYVLAITPTLFGESALVREWGRIGSSVTRRIDLHADQAGAGQALHTWLRRKARRGYVVCTNLDESQNDSISRYADARRARRRE